MAATERTLVQLQKEQCWQLEEEQHQQLEASRMVGASDPVTWRVVLAFVEGRSTGSTGSVDKLRGESCQCTAPPLRGFAVDNTVHRPPPRATHTRPRRAIWGSNGNRLLRRSDALRRG